MYKCVLLLLQKTQCEFGKPIPSCKNMSGEQLSLEQGPGHGAACTPLAQPMDVSTVFSEVDWNKL